MDLIEWTGAFIDYLNSFKHNLEKKEAEGNMISCVYRQTGQMNYIIFPELGTEIFPKLEGNVTIVCLNTKENISFLASNWNHFIKNQKLKMIFANPNANQQWSIIPYVHNMISDPKSLKVGLLSISENIPFF